MNWQERKTYMLLGHILTARIDRPVGYLHGDILYPINYGYIPGLMGGDGEEQDAYILGISEPVDSFTGKVVGVIRRHDDEEDKLVLAPEGQEYHQGQIAEAVHFQEQFFTGTIDCLFRKSCGCIPYQDTAKQREVLIVFQKGSQSWSFPKGHMEAGETEQETALRELKEETGLNARLHDGLKTSICYPLNDISRKEVVFFPAEATGQLSPGPKEIAECRWVPLTKLSDYLSPESARAAKDLLRQI